MTQIKYEIVRNGPRGIETLHAGATFEEAVQALKNNGAQIKHGEKFQFGEWVPMLETYPSLRKQFGSKMRELVAGFGTENPHVGITLREFYFE